jgi:hypothetical protein
MLTASALVSAVFQTLAVHWILTARDWKTARAWPAYGTEGAEILEAFR